MIPLDVLIAIRRHAERKIAQADGLIKRQPKRGCLPILRRYWARVAYRAQAHIERWEAEHASD